MNTDEWQPMDTFPKDGTRCEILFESGQALTAGRNAKGNLEGWFWGMELMGKGYCIRGTQNKMSPYLTTRAKGWRKRK